MTKHFAKVSLPVIAILATLSSPAHAFDFEQGPAFDPSSGVGGAAGNSSPSIGEAVERTDWSGPAMTELTPDSGSPRGPGTDLSRVEHGGVYNGGWWNPNNNTPNPPSQPQPPAQPATPANLASGGDDSGRNADPARTNQVAQMCAQLGGTRLLVRARTFSCRDTAGREIAQLR